MTQNRIAAFFVVHSLARKSQLFKLFVAERGQMRFGAIDFVDGLFAGFDNVRVIIGHIPICGIG